MQAVDDALYSGRDNVPYHPRLAMPRELPDYLRPVPGRTRRATDVPAAGAQPGAQAPSPPQPPTAQQPAARRLAPGRAARGGRLRGPSARARRRSSLPPAAGAAGTRRDAGPVPQDRRPRPPPPARSPA